MMQFELTPKALANFTPGLGRSNNPGIGSKKIVSTLKGLTVHIPNPFRV